MPTTLRVLTPNEERQIENFKSQALEFAADCQKKASARNLHQQAELFSKVLDALNAKDLNWWRTNHVCRDLQSLLQGVAKEVKGAR